MNKKFKVSISLIKLLDNVLSYFIFFDNDASILDVISNKNINNSGKKESYTTAKYLYRWIYFIFSLQSFTPLQIYILHFLLKFIVQNILENNFCT